MMTVSALKDIIALIKQTYPDVKIRTAQRKELLIADLINKGFSSEPDGNRAVASLISTWFMTPLRATAALSAGVETEEKALRQLPQFLLGVAGGGLRDFTPLATVQLGLVQREALYHSAGSIDGLLLGRASNGSPRAIGIEIKTHSASAKIHASEALAVAHGQVIELDCSTESGQNTFRRVVPDVSHRCQLLHHAAIFSELDQVLYVSCSPRKVIRVVFVTFGRALKTLYLRLLAKVASEYMTWVTTAADQNDLPDLREGQWGRAVNRRRLYAHLLLWRTLQGMALASPLPKFVSVKPSVVAAWNSVKIGVDQTSRGTNSAIAPHAAVKSEAILWLVVFLRCTRAAWKLVQCASLSTASINSAKTIEEGRAMASKSCTWLKFVCASMTYFTTGSDTDSRRRQREESTSDGRTPKRKRRSSSVTRLDKLGLMPIPNADSHSPVRVKAKEPDERGR